MAVSMDSDDDDVLFSSSSFGKQDKTLIGGQTKTLDDIMNSPRHRMKKTFGLCAAFLGLGLSVAVLGPTLRSLKEQAGVGSMERMAYVFSGRGLGYLGGTMLGGVFFEYWNPQLLMAVSLALACLGMFIIAFSKALWVLISMMSFVGIAMGILDTGANVVCIKMWGKRASAFLQMLHFAFAVGAFLAPLLATPFLERDLRSANTTNSSCLQGPSPTAAAPPPLSEVCKDSYCANGGTCTATGETPTCTCAAGFKGATCEDKDLCGDLNCANGGTCTTTGATATCSCTAGFTGATCEDKDLCGDLNCANGGNCTTTGETATCTCAAGFKGATCEDKDLCGNLNCANGGSCTTTGETATCTCAAGFKGATCEDKDLCGDLNCANGGSCTTTGETATCTCAAGFKGATCEDKYLCGDLNCANGGNCTTTGETATCTCAAGFKGATCEDKDLCGDLNCANGGSCTTTGETATCTCAAGFKGATCEDKDLCGDLNCANGGSCTTTGETATCTCAAGFKGATCEDKDLCGDLNCANGGSCTTTGETATCTCAAGFKGATCEDKDLCGDLNCANGGNCTTTGETATCTCAAGFKGATCEDKDLCGDLNCANGGSCTTTGETATCTCAAGFEGATCENKDLCGDLNCANGGTCNATGETATCKCLEGFQGDTCEKTKKPEKQKRSLKHDEIAGVRTVRQVETDCPLTCQNGGSCVQPADKASCVCKAGFTGATCAEKDLCGDLNCANGGTCTATGETATCTCTAGFKGATCEDKDLCGDLNCANGGNCTTTGETATCTCAAGFKGATCEDKDFCGDLNCANGGTCTATGETPTCTCAAGFKGTTCEDKDLCGDLNCANGGTCTATGETPTCTCAAGFKGTTCEDIVCGKSYCANGGTCANKAASTCKCTTGFKGATCEDTGTKKEPAPTGFRAVYILISLYLGAVSLLFCYFMYISPITAGTKPETGKSKERSDFEIKILFLLFLFYLIYVGAEVSFGGYISEFYAATFQACHGSLAAAWFWGTFAFGRGAAIFIATLATPWTMLVSDLVGGVVSTAILVFFPSSKAAFWLGTGLLGLSMASLFPAGIAWLESYVDVSGKVASVLVTGGVLGEMVIPLSVGILVFDSKTDGSDHPERLMYLMLTVCLASCGIFYYVYRLAAEMGVKSADVKQNSAVDMINGLHDAFKSRSVGASPPQQLKNPVIIGKKHKM
ncbi:uncharacterized protein [Apostichopus japonicus]|uniref:uncharacterized protein isoform X6 n=1 Tax=Stichopus japonicus TaxID=307972 RepID=UPI003AB8880E